MAEGLSKLYQEVLEGRYDWVDRILLNGYFGLCHSAGGFRLWWRQLQNMQGVAAVRPIPDAENSVAYVYLKHDGLPDLNKWPEQFTRTVNGTYRFRGVEGG